ncbi:MAG TPA: D-alanyl-D-alanine carboxypeptidase [Xanthobacteraceae bacterium]|nr:D-alanyl-D-alanine carboxypeptidase [Xanthobacteraceae bacterium]
MLRRRRGAPLVGWLAFAVSILLLAGALSASVPAHAKETWFSGFSSIVVDAKTGEVIDASKADELRHPASLAKVMTLYLLFAEIESGRLKLGSKLTTSSDATKQPPSKLGLKAGESISVQDAIKALVTRSANDVAVVIAEAVAGDEESFARMMTQRARALGMTRTVFTNASGLPDADQVTTAREMALLGLAIQDRFPKYYPYFATEKFHWRGVAIGNHNRLLGTVDGVDGIKTGYTRASGFNLLTNVERDKRHIVAVVMGGKTSRARDEHMRDMIAAQIRHAHAGPRVTPRFVEAPVPLPAPSPVTTAAVRRTVPVPGSDGPIERKAVRVVSIGKNGETIPEGDDDTPSKTVAVRSLSSATAQTPLPISPAGVAPEGKFVTFAPPPAPPATASASAQSSPEAGRAAVLAALAPEPPVVSAAKQAMAEIDAAAKKREGWIVQIGAFPSEELARDRLEDARGHAGGLLAKGNPYTEVTKQGSHKLYRARFAGFDEATAREACNRLKKNDFACFTTRN